MHDIQDIIKELEGRHFYATHFKDSYNEGYCDALDEAIELLKVLLD